MAKHVKCSLCNGVLKLDMLVGCWGIPAVICLTAIITAYIKAPHEAPGVKP